MGIAGSRRDIGVSEQPLRHLEVANGSRHASGRRVAQIVEAEVVYARFLLCLGPFARPPANAERIAFTADAGRAVARSEEHTSELQSLMRISYAVFCLKKKKNI